MIGFDNEELFVSLMIGGLGIFGILFAVYATCSVARQKLDGSSEDENAILTASEEDTLNKITEIYTLISDGAHSFLYQEWIYMGVFTAIFSVIICLTFSFANGKTGYVEGLLAAFAFIVGAVTSTLAGYIGMRIAVYANARTTIAAQTGVLEAFIIAFKAGLVMGGSLVALGVINLFAVICICRVWFPNAHTSVTEASTLFETVAGFGLGGSAIALFSRVGGGIYTKAADVGADLVGKVEQGIPEDDPRNPAVIADNVGDNVGDVAGMGADLFGSFGEVCCVCLVISSGSPQLNKSLLSMCYPLLVFLVGMVVCCLVAFFAILLTPPKTCEDVQCALKTQLYLSTIVQTGGVFLVAYAVLPHDSAIRFVAREPFETSPLKIAGATCLGLWMGLFIGLITEYFTSTEFAPVKEVAESCKSGAATNIIFGLALGYQSTIIPVFLIAATIFASSVLSGTYGISCAGVGILSTLTTALTIDVFGPICDNAGGIAEMAGLDENVRETTDALDAAGNTTAAIGKGFAIGSATFVAIALFSGFIKVSKHSVVDILMPQIVAGLLVGAMLPFWFTAMTMKSVGVAALEMVNEVRRQFRENPGILKGEEKPDYAACIEISTKASLREMIWPAMLVLFTPIITGFLFGTDTLGGVVIGAMLSGVQMAISSSNAGGAWDNAKKLIEARKLKVGEYKPPNRYDCCEESESTNDSISEYYQKGSAPHTAAVVGDTVGDPMKDTSGPSLNILIKLIAITSLVFASSFPTERGGYVLRTFIRQRQG